MAVTTNTASKQFTVGKLDAGMAILLTDDHLLIEFPSLLLPKGVSSGAIVNIAVHRNLPEEKSQQEKFWKLQQTLLDEYGKQTPQPPVLRIKSVTQTSVLLEWEPLQLAGATLRSLSVFRDGIKLPLQIPISPSSSGVSSQTGSSTMVRVSGLSVEHEYTLHVVMKTSAGVYESEKLNARTHSMEDLSGIRVFFGTVNDVEEQMTQEVEEEVDEEVEAEGEDADGTDMREKETTETVEGEVADEKEAEENRNEENGEPKENIEEMKDSRRGGDEEVDENDPVTDSEEGKSLNEGDKDGEPPQNSNTFKKNKSTMIVTRIVKVTKTVTVPRIVRLRSVLVSLGAFETPNGVTPETTHYVCDHPGGPDLDKALHANIPTVRPEWLIACEAQKGNKIPSTGEYYIGSSTSGGSNPTSSSSTVQPGKSTGSLLSK